MLPKFSFIGEATYLDDVPYLPNELHGALVQTTHANAKIANVDATEALNLSGVVAFVTAADIPGRNSFVVNAGPHPDPVSRHLLLFCPLYINPLFKGSRPK